MQKDDTAIQINLPSRCNSFTSSLLDVYVSLNNFWEPPRPSSGAYNCINSLWFYRWSVVVAALLVVVGPNIAEPMQQMLHADRRTDRRT
jgi:hypothetical protein